MGLENSSSRHASVNMPVDSTARQSDKQLQLDSGELGLSSDGGSGERKRGKALKPQYAPFATRPQSHGKGPRHKSGKQNKKIIIMENCAAES